MMDLNSEIDLKKKSFSEVASQFLNVQVNEKQTQRELLELLYEHLYLTFVPVFFACLLGIPIAFWSSKRKSLKNSFGLFATLVQTIPGLALLTFLIPITGIGATSAMIVLFLYAILPIFVNSVLGFQKLSPLLELSCNSLQMTQWQKLFWVQGRIALPVILGGIQTSMVVTVGNATLAALIGSGGFGKKIIAGLAVNDIQIVLQGALPSAALALILYALMEILIRNSNWYKN